LTYKQLFPTLVFLFLFTFSVVSQEHPSIHQTEYEKYKDLPKKASLFDPSGAGIVPLRNVAKRTPTSAVFGYFPYWKYPESVADMQFDLLSHIAVFDFSVLSNGNLSPPSAWPWTDLINAAHEAGVKIILTAVNFTGSQIHELLTDPDIKENFFAQLKSYLQTYDLQGVNIDFENIYQSDRGDTLNGFMADLSLFLHSELPGSEVSIAVPPVNWGGWQFTGLAEACDYIFIMGYNFYGPWSSTSGACAPLTGGSYNISRTVNNEFAAVAENDPDKLILGVPYYGNRWETEDGEAYSTAIDHTNQPTYSIAKNTADEHGSLWDGVSQTPYCSYIENESWYQVWYDSDTSLGLKYDLAEAFDYKGVGMWALGYDSDKPELWDEIRRRYTGASAIGEVRRNQVEISIVNTEENNLKIRFSADANDQITLVLTSITGRVICQHSYKATFSGIQLTEIPVRDVLQGIYIVKVLLRGGNSLRMGTVKILI